MSMFERVGDVQYVGEKNGYWSFKLDDEKWYGTGDQKPEFEKGDRIKFSGSTNQKGDTTYYNVDLETVKVKKGGGTVKPYKKSGGGGRNTVESKAYWDKRTKMDEDRVLFDHEKHETIGEFSVRNSAIAYLNVLKEVGALPIGKLKTAAAIHKAMDGCLDAIIEKFSGKAPPVPNNVVNLPTVTGHPDNFKGLEDPDEFGDSPATTPATTDTTGGDNDQEEEW